MKPILYSKLSINLLYWKLILSKSFGYQINELFSYLIKLVPVKIYPWFRSGIGTKCWQVPGPSPGTLNQPIPSYNFHLLLLVQVQFET